jgi:hypothetical protein
VSVRTTTARNSPGNCMPAAVHAASSADMKPTGGRSESTASLPDKIDTNSASRQQVSKRHCAAEHGQNEVNHRATAQCGKCLVPTDAACLPANLFPLEQGVPCTLLPHLTASSACRPDLPAAASSSFIDSTWQQRGAPGPLLAGPPLLPLPAAAAARQRLRLRHLPLLLRTPQRAPPPHLAAQSSWAGGPASQGAY